MYTFNIAYDIRILKQLYMYQYNIKLNTNYHNCFFKLLIDICFQLLPTVNLWITF